MGICTRRPAIRFARNKKGIRKLSKKDKFNHKLSTKDICFVRVNKLLINLVTGPKFPEYKNFLEIKLNKYK